MANISNPLPYITKREYGLLPNFRNLLFQKRLDVAKSLYRKDLVCHYGCVNAIEFSNNGEFLVSGGDDRRVMVWSVPHAATGGARPATPTAMRAQHQSNIFCLALTHDHKTIYSGGNDDIVIVHDVGSGAPTEVLRAEGAVCGLAADPRDARRLASAGSDGRLLLFDTRRSVHECGVVARAGAGRPFHGVAFHPRAPLLASANARDGAALYDLRHHKMPLVRYVGAGGGARESCMSVCWDAGGRRLLVLRRRRTPALYAAHSPRPLAECAHPDYYNSCTMKSGCFAGPQHQLVLSGSDDFNLYAWRVPQLYHDNEVIETTQRVSPQLVLSGHRSIVNQVRYNPHYGLIASSGVEKIIKLWSTWQWTDMRGSLLTTAEVETPRELYSHEDYVSLVHHSAPAQYLSHNYSEQSTREDPRMMAFFDNLVQRELECGADLSDSLSATSRDDSDGARAPVASRLALHKRARSSSQRLSLRYLKTSRSHKARPHRVRKQSRAVHASTVLRAGAGAGAGSGKGKRAGRGAGRPLPVQRSTDSDDGAGGLHARANMRSFQHAMGAAGAATRTRRRGALCRGVKRKVKSVHPLLCRKRSAPPRVTRVSRAPRTDLPSTSTGYRGGADSVTSLYCISELESETERFPRAASPAPRAPLNLAPPQSHTSWVSLRLATVETNDSERESSASTSDTFHGASAASVFRVRSKKPRRNYRTRRDSDSN